MAKFLYTVFHLTANDARSDNYAFIYACEAGHLDIAQWLYTTFHLTIEDARSAAVRLGDHHYSAQYPRQVSAAMP